MENRTRGKGESDYGLAPLCECGCGRPVRRNKRGRSWTKYHSARCMNRASQNRVDAGTRRLLDAGEYGEAPLCKCGCGQRVSFLIHDRRWARYCFGHWPRDHGSKAAMDKAKDWNIVERLQILCKELIGDAPTKHCKPLPFCKCGCGLRVGRLGILYLPGHFAAKRLRERGSAPLCACGCGEQVGWGKGKWNKYVSPEHAARDPEYRRRMSEIMNHPDKIEELSRKSAANYRREDYVRNLQRGLAARPNRFEYLFDTLTDATIRYVGDGGLWIELGNGRPKNPDFIVVGTKKVIELHGDYWHRGEDSEELVELYKAAGYECLVIWERDLGDIGCMLERVSRFIEKDTCQMELGLGLKD